MMLYSNTQNQICRGPFNSRQAGQASTAHDLTLVLFRSVHVSLDDGLLAHRALDTPREPLVYTRCVKGMSTLQDADRVLVFKGCQTNCALFACILGEALIKARNRTCGDFRWCQ